MRIKIFEKNARDDTCMLFSNLNIQNLRLPKNDAGYLMVIEGSMPYNTNEGQI